MGKTIMLAIAGIIFSVAGCAALFGGPVDLIGQDGKPVMNPDGTRAQVYKEGAIQKLTRAIAPIASVVPYGGAGAALLGIIGAVGAGVQTARHRGRVKADDVRKLIDEIGPEVKNISSDKDLGDLVGKWQPDSELGRKLKSAFLKNRNGV